MCESCWKKLLLLLLDAPVPLLPHATGHCLDRTVRQRRWCLQLGVELMLLLLLLFDVQLASYCTAADLKLKKSSLLLLPWSESQGGGSWVAQCTHVVFIGRRREGVFFGGGGEREAHACFTRIQWMNSR